VNVARVQAWRSRHPGYWRRDRRVGTALQDVSVVQPIDSFSGTASAAGSPLQEILIAQPAVLMGLIAHIVGTPLQDDIVRTTDRLLRLGQDILATSGSVAICVLPGWLGCFGVLVRRHRSGWRSNRNGGPVPASG
jgi:hypothetical protein